MGSNARWVGAIPPDGNTYMKISNDGIDLTSSDNSTYLMLDEFIPYQFPS